MKRRPLPESALEEARAAAVPSQSRSARQLACVTQALGAVLLALIVLSALLLMLGQP